MSKPILCLDFDGVIHSYTSGWKGATVIPDPPVPGTIAYLREAVKHFAVHIFSSRSHQEGGLGAMMLWLQAHALQQAEPGESVNWLNEIHWPQEKPPALVTIDDRAIRFNGDWRDPRYAPAALLGFKPWNKE